MTSQNPTALPLVLTCILGTGLVAGVFFAFSSFVMPALARLPPAQGIAAMQSINVTVLNVVFLGVFLGTAVACGVLGWSSLANQAAPEARWAIAGCALYLVGSILVTMVCNVPRNDALAALPATAHSAAAWTMYVQSWTAWNTVRGLTSLGATALLTVALAFSRAPR